MIDQVAEKVDRRVILGFLLGADLVGRLGQAARQHLVDALAVEVDHLQPPVLPGGDVAGARQAADEIGAEQEASAEDRGEAA